MRTKYGKTVTERNNAQSRYSVLVRVTELNREAGTRHDVTNDVTGGIESVSDKVKSKDNTNRGGWWV